MNFSKILLITVAFFLSQNLLIAKTENLAFLLSHGLGGDKNQLAWYKKNNKINWHILPDPSYSFDFPEAQSDPEGLDSRINTAKTEKIFLAQGPDLKALEDAHNSLTFDANLKIDNVVLFGVSRGAAAVINYASSNPSKIKALVLEAPFDCVENIIDFWLKQRYIGYMPGSSFIGNYVHRNFIHNRYDKNGIKPNNSVTKINKNLPIIFIHSKEDKLIPIDCSRNLYNMLKKAGFKHVYLLELDYGEHANYQFGYDAKKYQATVHAFYKKYGINCDDKLANQGKKFLSYCQPELF